MDSIPLPNTYGKKWYFITASFAFGQDILKSSRDLLKAAGGTEVGVDEVPLNTADYSSFILKIRQAKPDVVLGGLSAGDLSTFLKQWNELGMKGKIPFVEIAIGDTDIWAVGPEAASGVFTKLWLYNNPNNPPEEKAFADAYMKKHNRPAADKAWMGWITAKSLFESIEAAKSTETMPIIEALENWKFDSAGVHYNYRKWDHQMQLRNLVVQVKPKITDKWDYFDVKAALPEIPPSWIKCSARRKRSAAKWGETGMGTRGWRAQPDTGMAGPPDPVRTAVRVCPSWSALA